MALGASLHAVGQRASIATLITVSSLADVVGGAIPVPGGLGVVEADLIAGLASAAAPGNQAVAAVLIQRFFTAARRRCGAGRPWPGCAAANPCERAPLAGPVDADGQSLCARMMTSHAGPGQAGPMNLDGLSGLVSRVIARADRLQREHGVLGFPYAVIKKYGDDAGGRQAALITYYGFLSIFPLLLLGVAVLSRVLADHPDLRRRLIDEIVPKALRPTIEHSLATLPTSTIPFVVGLVSLLLAGTGVVFSAYQTLNHVAAVRHRRRLSYFARYARVFAVLATVMAGALAVGTLTVVATALPGERGVERAAAVAGSALVVFGVLLLGAKLLLARPAPVRVLWPGAVLGAAAVTVVLNAGAPLLARLVIKAGPVYGSFATVAGMFALLYLIGRALVYAAEVAAVRYARLWPRALDLTHPTAADARALALLAREQERIPAARVEFHLVGLGCPPTSGGTPPADDGPG